MSTAMSTSSPKGAKEAARKRKRRVAIGAGVSAGVGAGLLLLYLAKNANADEGEPDDPGPSDGGKRGGRADFKTLAVGAGDTEGTGDDGSDSDDAGADGPDAGGVDGSGDGGLDPGGSGSGGGPGAGPGGSGLNADGPRRTNPKTPGGKKPGGDKSPKRANPKGKSPKRANPKGPAPKRTNPKPKGPNPKIRDLERYYNAEWPDPGKFYQVGGQDSDGLYGIAWRWFYTCLFLAARNAGDLDDEAARAWASARVGPKGGAQAEHADFILCVAWNDINYGSYVVAAKNRRGPHGRGIDLVPQHADNWWRIRKRKRARRNVEVGQPSTTGTPRNAGQGNAKLPLLWLPRLNDQRLWESNGRTLKAAGTWADGSSFYFPPPVVMKLGIDDATGTANLSVWGCGAGQGDYG